MIETRQVLFIQGAGEGTHDEWDVKLVDSLRRELGGGFEVRYPRLPDEDDPDDAAWTAAIRQEIDDLEDGAVVVGHSVGATILIHALAKQQPAVSLGAIVLVAAPWVGTGGWPADRGSSRPTWARDCRPTSRSTRSLASTTTPSRRRTPTCTLGRSRRRTCIDCRGAITS